MKLLSILDSFKDKKFKYGGYAALVTAVLICVLVLFNLLIDQIPVSIDLTINKKYSISDQTYNVIDNLTEDIVIYHLAQTGMENPIVDEILSKYVRRSKKITMEYIDPVRSPTRLKKYEKEGQSISEGSLIIDGADRFKIVSRYDLINYSYDQQYQETQAQSLAIEQRLTSALLYVSGGASATIYQLTGHREDSIPYEIYNQLELENYSIEDINLIVQESIPAEDSILVVNSPKLDISSTEEEKINAYLSAGGKAFILVDLTANEMPNLDKLLNSFGVERQNAIIYEMDASRTAGGNPLFLLPAMKSHDIVYPLVRDGLQLVIPWALSIKERQLKRRTIEVTPLLTTSGRAYAKVDLESTVQVKEEGDLEGPFNIAVAVTDEPVRQGGQQTRIVVMGNGFFLNPTYMTAVPGNANLYLNSLNWLEDRKESISIRPKSLTMPYLQLSQLMAQILSGIVVILMPLGVLGTGLFVWLRRRHL